jgi:hypothetical protein
MYRIDLELFSSYSLDFKESYIIEDIKQELTFGSDVFVDDIQEPHFFIIGGSVLFPGAGSHISVYGDLDIDLYHDTFIDFISQRNKDEGVFIYLFSPDF